MKAHHITLSKYWAATAQGFSANGLHHMAALFARYSAEHAALALGYED